MTDYAPGGPLKAAFYFASGFGHQAVLVFFVLSGFLVGRKVRELAQASDPDFRGYVIDRASRIFTVALPAIAWSGAALWLLCALAPRSPLVVGPSWSAALQHPLASDLNPIPWLATIVLLNTFVAPTPAIEAPLWSLAWEWSYYMVAVGLVAALRRRWSWTTPYAIALLGLCLACNLDLIWGGLVWLFGLAASIASDRGWLRGRITLAAITLLAAIVFLASRALPIPDWLIGLAIALMTSHRAWRGWSPQAAVGERLAGFSYTLYAFHFPATVLIAAALGRRLAFGPPGVLAVVGGLAVTVLGAYYVSRLTEARTPAVRRWLAGGQRAVPAG